ncbi:MAG: hypothetical protein ABH837_01125 [bacterium]
MIKYNDFQKLDIRIGKVTEVLKVENADKLYKLQVDFGKDASAHSVGSTSSLQVSSGQAGSGHKQVIAGIADKFSESDLRDKLFPFVFNMEPAKIRGLESQAMILVAEDESKNLALLLPSKDIKPGSKIV